MKILLKSCSFCLLIILGYVKSMLIIKNKLNLVKFSKLSSNLKYDYSCQSTYGTEQRNKMKLSLLSSTSDSYCYLQKSNNVNNTLKASTNDSGIDNNIFKRAKNFIMSFLLVLPLMLTISLSPVKARVSKNTDSSQKQSAKLKSNQMKATINTDSKNNRKSNSKSTARIELIVTDDDDLYERKSNKNKQLTNLGVLLVAISGIYIVVAPDSGKNGSKKINAVQKKNRKSRISQNNYDEDEEEVIQSTKFTGISSRNQMLGETTTPPLSSKLSGKYKDLMKLPSEDDLFGEDTSIDDIFESDVAIPMKNKAANNKKVVADTPKEVEEPVISIPFGRQKMSSKLLRATADSTPSTAYSEDDDALGVANEDIVPPFASIVPAPEASKLSPASQPVVLPEVTKENDISEQILDNKPIQSPKKPPGILGRLFQKPGGGRATDIKTALKNPSDPTHDYRTLVASCLSAYVPSGTLTEVEEGGSLSSSTDDAFSTNDDVRMQALTKEIEYSGLTEQEAAESFAEVTNALMTQIVDQTIQSIDKSSKDKSQDVACESLDLLTDFIRGAGGLFGETTPKAQIEPIQYNGKANKGKLENLYYLYAKASTDMKSILGMIGGGADNEANDTAVDPAVKAADKADRLGKVQFLFNIKEGKRNSIEQRISREMMMDMTKELSSGEVGGDLGKMMEAITGKSGDASIDDIMSQFASGDNADGMPGGGGAMPNMNDMSQEDLAKLMKEAMSSVKASLEEGTVTKADVLEFEKLIGMNVKQMVSMFDSGRVDKKQLQKLNPDLAEMMDVFKQLAAIK